MKHCVSCKHLRKTELSDEVYSCPMVNIRINIEWIRKFGCTMHRKKRKAR